MNLTKEFLERLNAVTAKRPKTVIQFILKHGYVTTEDLQKLGYKHAPRAARDVRELGIPLVTFRIKNANGKNIAAYKFGDATELKEQHFKVTGRTALSKALKKALVDKYGAVCFIYLQRMDESQLQVDHRVPYEIGGEQDTNNIDCFMLLSPSANRAKSWTCEHCPNWERKDYDYCVSCFWAHPEKYTHIADKEQRQIIITFTGNEIEDYLRLIEYVGIEKAEDTIKQLIKKYILDQ